MQVVHSKNKSYITSNILLQKGRVRAITDISFKVYLIRRNKRWKNQAKTATKYIVWHRAVLYKLCISRILQLKLTFLFLLLPTKGSFDKHGLSRPVSNPWLIHFWSMFKESSNWFIWNMLYYCMKVSQGWKVGHWNEQMERRRNSNCFRERKILSHPE